jgi:hypothetical protein
MGGPSSLHRLIANLASSTVLYLSLTTLPFSSSLHSSFPLPPQVSYRLSQFAALDIEINKFTDALRDVAFPTINKEAYTALLTNKKYLNKLKDLEHCRMSLEQWVYYVISRSDIFPSELRQLIENFFILPSGPLHAAAMVTNSATPKASSGGPNGNFKSPTLADFDSPTSNSRAPSGDGGSSSVWDDELSETKSVWTIGSLDEATGVPKKKKKRIMKGLKKRVSHILNSSSSTKKEQFGVDFSGVSGGGELAPGAPVPSRSVVSGVSSNGSDQGGRPSVASSAASMQCVQPSKLLKVRVSRGGEKSRGQPEYEV